MVSPEAIFSRIKSTEIQVLEMTGFPNNIFGFDSIWDFQFISFKYFK